MPIAGDTAGGQGEANVDLEQLKAAIRRQLDKLVRLNRTRIDFLAKFED
jgi:type I restriction enzyme R subunit